MDERQSSNNSYRQRIRIGLVLVMVGVVAFIIGAEPERFGLDRSPVTGFVQISVFLAGLAMVCLGGYISLNALWNGMQKTIAADIGLRLVSTGYVISFASAMADILGFGSQVYPNIPYFGPIQQIGVMLGEIMILLGFVLMIPFPSRK
jgi:hypothetical protein